jgi:hypothetical protein
MISPKEQKKLDETVKHLNRLVASSLLIVAIAFVHILAPDTTDRWYANEGKKELHVVSMESDAISDTLVVDGIHVASGLIVDEGFIQVKATCLACHSSKLVTQNRATRDGWEKMIRWMQETQNLWDLGTNEDIILDYLAKNYAPDDAGRRRNLPSPKWYVLED